MKKTITVLFILFIGCQAFAGELNKEFKFGVQASSDSYFGFILKGGPVEFGLKAKWQSVDSGDGIDMLIAGSHLAWLFNGKSGNTSFGVGADFRVGLGSSLTDGTDLAEYVDAFLRLSYNYHLSEHVMLTGIFYPLSFSTRETDVTEWYSIATIPSAAVAFTVLF